MTRTLLALILAFSAAGAGAANWPWRSADPGPSPQFCKGLLTGGLGSNKVSGASRTNLWLAWSYVVGPGDIDLRSTQDEYQAGLARFHLAADAAAAERVLGESDGSCGIGRSGMQVTGW